MNKYELGPDPVLKDKMLQMMSLGQLTHLKFGLLT